MSKEILSKTSEPLKLKEQCFSDSRKDRTIGIFVITFLWNIPALALLYDLIHNYEKKDLLTLIVGPIFPLFGLLFIMLTINGFLQWRKFGDKVSLLLYNQTDKFHGKIQTHHFGARNDFHLYLRCDHLYKVEKQGRRKQLREMIWQSSYDVPLTSCGSNEIYLEIPVSFSIPPEIQEKIISRMSESNTSSIDWTLTVFSDMPFISFSTQFSVPVEHR